MDQPRAVQEDILVVDDQKENLDILREILLEEGYHVRPVTSGEMALVAARERKPDLILLDVNMPEMSGFEVCERLKQQDGYAEVPVLFITALQQTENKLLAFQVGGSDYITKPFHFEEVKARVRTHLRLHRLHEELRLRNEALHSAHRELLKLEKLRDNLTAMIVHDLRAPLSGIVGSLKFMQEDAQMEDGRVLLSDLARAVDSSRRLMQMINDLLDIARLEANEMPLNQSDVRVSDIVATLIVLIGPEKAPRLVVEPPALSLTIRGDRNLLERVLLNLVDNAFKYSPADSSVDVSFQEQPDALVLLVEDRGPGIPDEFKEKVFEKFGQVDARKAKVFATGLGLSFCKLAVEAHGGSVRLEDRAGGGTRMVVRIPRDGARATSAAALERSSSRAQ